MALDRHACREVTELAPLRRRPWRVATIGRRVLQRVRRARLSRRWRVTGAVSDGGDAAGAVSVVGAWSVVVPV